VAQPVEGTIRLAVAISQAPGLRGTPVAAIRQGRNEGVLRQFLGESDVARDPRQAGDQPGPLDPEDRFSIARRWVSDGAATPPS
jgi:hypothetical protein